MVGGVTLPRLLRILALLVFVFGVWVAIVVFHDRTVMRGEMPSVEFDPRRWITVGVAVLGCVGLILASIVVESGRAQDRAHIPA